jgi:valyl-tRNA synthetase
MFKTELPKTYDSKQYEDVIYTAWEKSGFFNPDNLPEDRTETFSIVLPPPNVTGTLHMGHAVMLAIEDAMVRFARMRGKKTLWIPGTDHAAIATQTKVEKMLIQNGMKDPRGQLGREEFLKRVETFAAQSHDIIVNQTKKIGASMDWSREAFTLDATRSRAVNTAFKMMYDDGLIYRGNRIVNWCPRCKSTLADDEVEYKEEKTKFYYFKYGPVVIGTARPETKFADKVIIVHPDDTRYKKWIGKEMEVEWIEGPVKAKLIADPIADMDLGSGAMTITPAHSFVDFELAKKYGFEVLIIIDEDGNLTSAAGSFAGKNANVARDEIVERLRKKGLVDHIDENYIHNLSICYRCGTAIEPLPKLQWFIDVNKSFGFHASTHAPIDGLKEGQMVTLKQLMQHVVSTNQVRIIPDRFEKTYFHWIDNLRDWNISRQIWYGHRVPVWYRSSSVVARPSKQDAEIASSSRQGWTPRNDTKEVYVGVEAPQEEGWQQDSDTLDTWFSSGLWTISTLGWPDKSVLTKVRDREVLSTLKQFHPTSVLETGYDILFFWVARMILMTTYAVGEVPFRDVYLHGLVRDEQGRKMSKSLDNIIDPLEMIAKFGADATRLSLVIGTTPGNDSKLSEKKVAGYRNFTNKLWNIARFVFLSSRATEESESISTQSDDNSLADRWIISRFATVTDEVTKHLEQYEFSQAGEKLRDFTWSEFADWYLEISKVEKHEEILRQILHDLLILWHPFMPFVTEQIYSVIQAEIASSSRQGGTPRNDKLLMIQPWPTANLSQKDEQSEKAFAFLQQLIVAIRNIRSEHHIEPKTRIAVLLIASQNDQAFIESNEDIIKTLARVETLTFVEQEIKNAVTALVGSVRLFVELSIFDQSKQRQRLETEISDLEQYLQSLDQKLANEEFTSKAPKDVVESIKQKYTKTKARLDTLRSQLL